MHERAGMLLLSLAVLASAVLPAPDAAASGREIPMTLRVDPEMRLEGTERIHLGPVLVEPRAESLSEGLDVIATREFERYLWRLLRRETKLVLVDPVEDIDLPTTNPRELIEMASFWQEIGRESESDFIVTAAIDVEILDRAGYQTEEYVSPQDGKTYFRQVLVEETGFSYDVLLHVLSGETGEVVFSEQITDFQEKSERKLEVYTDMFDDLYTLENRVLGIFVPRYIRAKRYLFR